MSLSNGPGAKPKDRPNKFMAGKVFLGDGHRAVSITELESARKRPGWNQAMEEEYMERVRAKAATRARAIIDTAEKEAGHIRLQAKEQGYAEGIAQAREELQNASQQMSEALGAALEAVALGGRSVWAKQRHDLLTLIRLAVEKTVGMEVTRRGSEVLETLLDQALDSLESQRELFIRVHPSEVQDLAGLLAQARSRYPTLEAWRVRGDETLEPGGLVVESALGMVDNSLEGRMEQIRSVLDQLTLPEPGECGVDGMVGQPFEQPVPKPQEVATDWTPEPMPQAAPQAEPQTAPESAQQAAPDPAADPAPEPTPAERPRVNATGRDVEQAVNNLSADDLMAMAKAAAPPDARNADDRVKPVKSKGQAAPSTEDILSEAANDMPLDDSDIVDADTPDTDTLDGA